ncbi:hypothetical protein ABMY20_10600 [Tenacibaculum sp. SSH1-16]|uniref:hypothetical protein n=1 Tax=Tenacibaculum sp. SSH1-16 TaxID=3136667 RepID=UPI0032C46395
MIEKLIVDFFKKIETDEGIDSRNGKANFFVNSLLEEKHGKFHYISIQKATRIHKKYVEKDNTVSANVKDPFLKDVMAEYLGFEDFKNYKENIAIDPVKPFTIGEEINLTGRKEEEENKLGVSTTLLKNKTPILIGAILLVSVFIFYKDILFEKSNCIVWEKDHYTKAPCYYLNSIDNTTYHIDIDRFKKVTLTKDMEFFTNGKENFWYGSNKDGKREFFTARGIHPETLKELAPITRTILKDEGLLNE